MENQIVNGDGQSQAAEFGSEQSVVYERKSHWQFPWRKLLAPLAIFILAAGFIGAAGYLAYWHYRETLQAESQAVLLTIADGKTRQIADWLAERQKDVEVFAGAPFVAAEVPTWLTAGAPAGTTADTLLAWLRQLKSSYDYAAIALVDSQDQVRLSTGDTSLSSQAQTVIAQARQSGRVTTSDLYLNVGHPALDLAVPLGGGQDAPCGAVLYFSIDPQRYLFPLIQNWPTPSPSAETLLIRREGDQVVFLNELRHRQSTALRFKLPLGEARLPASRAVLGELGLMQGLDYRRRPVLAVTSAIPGTTWFMVAKVDLDEVNGPVRTLTHWATALSILFVIGVSTTIGLWWRRQQASWLARHYQMELERYALVQHFDYLARYANDIVLLMDLQGCLIEANDRAVTAYGYSREELLRLTLDDLQASATSGSTPPVEDLDGQIFETIHRRKDGECFAVEVSARLIDIYGNQFLHKLIRDITERKRAEQALFEEKERIRVTLHSIGDAVITTDADSRVQYLNPVAETLSGWSAEEAQGQPLAQVFNIINEDTREPASDPVERCLAQGRIVGLANHTILISRTGWEYAIQDSAAPIRGTDGVIFGAVLVFSDVSETRRLTKAIFHQASHDALTGLMNRIEFERRLSRVLKATNTEGVEHALGYLDLDQFKIINDTCGHAAGDELLRKLSALLQDQVRQQDTLARLGGDEFGVLLENCSVEDAQRVAKALHKAVEGFWFMWGDKRFSVGVSIGLVPIDHTSADVASVLSAADAACYMAKEQGRNRIHVYQVNDEQLTRRQGEMQWAARIPRALAENQFQLSFQPIVPLNSHHEPGDHYELLIRLQDEDGQLIGPGVFLPAAERYNLATPLDRWVISTAFQWLIDHPAQVQQLALCAINLSGHSLSDESFQEYVTDQLVASHLPPAKICFEITETAAIANFVHATRFINSLKQLGCRFALDDFGSGLSSFGYLKELPVDFLKIDGSFVKDIVDDPTSLAIVKSIHDIGQVMGKQTIAEFVENEHIVEKLRLIGVHYAQGYHFGKPQRLQ